MAKCITTCSQKSAIKSIDLSNEVQLEEEYEDEKIKEEFICYFQNFIGKKVTVWIECNMDVQDETFVIEDGERAELLQAKCEPDIDIHALDLLCNFEVDGYESQNIRLLYTGTYGQILNPKKVIDKHTKPLLVRQQSCII